jgi:hypothetical protein
VSRTYSARSATWIARPRPGGRSCARYLWDAAWCLHETSDGPTAETWVARHARTLLTGAALDVAADIDRQACAARLRGAKRKGLDDAIGYLTNKAEHLRYDTALANGWPIATGVIQGACRHLVKDRLDITGVHPQPPGPPP